MRLGGYFPFRTERERFDLRINAGFFDDIGDAFSDAFGGDDNERGAFESGQNVQIDDQSFQSPGTTGGAIDRETEFARAKSDFERGFGRVAGTAVGGLSGIPGASSLLGGLAGGQTFATDAAGAPLA